MSATAPSLDINNNSNTGSVQVDSNFNVNGCVKSKDAEQPLRIVRQYINPAVYIESSIYDMAPFRRSPIFLNYNSDDEAIHKVVKVKRCVCFTTPNHCPCHLPNSARESTRRQDEKGPNFPRKSESPPNSDTSLKCELECRLTARRSDVLEDELKISIPSVTTMSTLRIDDSQKEEAFRHWCIRKDQERKLQDEKEALIREIKQKEREIQLQQERENFRRWLTKKKEEEKARKKEKEKELEEDRRKQELKEKRLQENELHYQLWLKKKEELYLERRIQEQMKMLRVEEDKQKRLEGSMKAYEHWLNLSKHKPKPIPLNQGLQSLRSSVSVTYVNPTPWVPNVDMKPKPASQ